MNGYGSEWQEIRALILERDSSLCRYCGSDKNPVVHHIRPISRGGRHDYWNLITLCARCHALEHRYIKEWGLCTIPSFEFEEYRDLLTDPQDVALYHAALLANRT